MSFGTQASDFPEGCALVFGGSGGLGRQIAGLLAERGSDVALTYRSNAQNAAEMADTIEGLGRKAAGIACDVTDRAAVKAAVAEAQQEFGRIHTVVSAGGLVFDTGPLADFKESAFRGVIETDVVGFFNIAQEVLPALREGGGGSVVALITSAVGRTVPLDALSATPKAAVSMMVRHIATEEARNGIRANAVGPGVVDAGMVIPMMQGPQRKLLEAATDATPLGRWGEAAEIAEAVAFLASSKASYITGQMLMVDGGISA